MSLLTFKYTARNSATGKKETGVIQADSEVSAARMINEMGLSPVDIKVKEGGDGSLSAIFNRIPTKDKILLSRQLATLINAGLPLVQSLRTVMGQTKNKALKVVIGNVIADVESGATLASSLGKHPKTFNRIFVSLVEAGEASGTLDKSLERLALQQEKDAEVISKVRGAMIYPLIVFGVMIGVVSFMLVAVLPQVQELYKGFKGVQLPILTRILLAVSDFVRSYWWVVILIVGIAAFASTKWVQSVAGRRALDAAKMRVQPIGRLFMKMYMARFTRTGSTLIASGVPLIQALEITSDAVNNVIISESIKAAIEKVKGGKSLSESLMGDRNFLELVPNMLKIGEESGQIEQMMSKTADYFEKEVDDEIRAISTIIEPIMMIVLGIVAIIIVAAVLLPIYGLVGQNIIR